MINIFKTSKSVSLSIDEFFDKIDLGILNFKKGIQNYIDGNLNEFTHNLKSLSILENEADSIQRKIENDFYLHSLMPNYASDIINLLESVDDIIDMSKDILSQFDVETPHMPEAIKKEYLELVDLAAKSAENVVSAARIFFTSPDVVKDRIQKVLFYQRETDTLSNNIKRKIFQEFDSLKLSEKIHLRYFALHIEQVSGTSKNIAHQLSSLVIKIKM
jgi:predicted phosphate transport protein (TIGR00153 family)